MFKRAATAADRLIAPLALFVSFYLATFWIGLWTRFPYVQWTGLVSVCCATAAAIALWHNGRWDLGLVVRPGLAVRETAAGLAGAVALVGAADCLIILVTGTRHAPGSGFPYLGTVAVFLPAALHEELLFRGYPYQLVRRWNRTVAIAVSSIVFAALHAGNQAVTVLALVNIGLGGVFLALAYERHQRLWLPIGLHFAWNVMSGPVLGYGVSGFVSPQTLLATVTTGRTSMTGGAFGIEGSALMTAVEVVSIGLLWGTRQKVESGISN